MSTGTGDLVKRLARAAKNVDGMHSWFTDDEDSDCEPSWSMQQETAEDAAAIREAMTTLEAAERVIAPFAAFHVGVSANDDAIAAVGCFTKPDQLPVSAFRAARDWLARTRKGYSE